MHVSRVESNLKGAVDIVLAPLTLVVAPSGSIKTAAWNSLELVFLGGCSDVGVYDWRAKEVDLLDALAPPNAKKLWAKVTMSDGQLCTVEIARNAKSGGAKRAVRKVPVEAALPVHPFRAGLRGSTSSIRSFLLSHVTGVITEKDVVSRIPGALSEPFNILMDAERGADDRPIDLLLSVLAACKDKRNVAKRRADAAKAVSDANAARLDPEPTDDDIKGAKLGADSAVVALQVAQVAQVQTRSNIQAPPSAQTLQTLYQDAHGKVQRLQGMDVEIQGLTAVVGAQDPVNAEAERLRSALIMVMNAHLGGGVSSCACCGGEFERMTDAHAWMIRQRDGLVGAAQAQVQHANVRDRMAELTRARVQMEAAASQAVAAYTVAKDAAAAYVPPAPVDTTAVDEAVADVGVFNTTLHYMLGLRSDWDQVRGSRVEAQALTEESSKWAAVLSACEAAVSGIMDSVRQTYVDRVNEHLPQGTEFDLRLSEERTEGKVTETCKFGLVREGALHTAISGAELGQVVAAMTAATLPETVEGPVIVTLPRDVGMDREALRSTMGALAPLAKMGVQVILFSVVGHAGSRPAGWTVLTMNADGTLASRKAGTRTKKAKPSAIDAAATVTPPVAGTDLPPTASIDAVA